MSPSTFRTRAVVLRKPKRRSDGRGGSDSGEMEGDSSVYTKEEAVYGLLD